MPESTSIDQMKKTHLELYTRLLTNTQEKATKFAREKYQQQFIEEADALLAILDQAFHETVTLDEYTWLVNTALQWQIAFSSVLDVPKNIRIPGPPTELWASSSQLSIDDITARVTSQADLLSKIRRAQASQLAFRKPSSQEERDLDWYQAETYFALEIIDRRLDLATKVPPGAYCYLERVWLRDLIRMKAYFRYLDKAPTLVQSDDEAREDYFWACNHYRRLLIHGEKSSNIDFLPVSMYIKENFLDKSGEEVDATKVAFLIENKARQCHIIKHAECVQTVRKFVYAFYNNIIPAVVARDEAALMAVQDAIILSEGPASLLSIMNSFEAAIAIYFLKALDKLPPEWY